MGGHDVIEMPYFLLNGGSMTDQNMGALQKRQEGYAQVLIVDDMMSGGMVWYECGATI